MTQFKFGWAWGRPMRVPERLSITEKCVLHGGCCTT
eukprot:CAMPEP_0184312318 /NCGR_PEP_ID=MMETSP1049-20130417/49051_1 /TAXON_ID=77928 /ORGANISM="Proteomonas sulcata, Strain CCMP704" /LENGTH=35 /DNA_ID= /DNA_START= /DNA_END= /DNA_ORIENTATION=